MRCHRVDDGPSRPRIASVRPIRCSAHARRHGRFSTTGTSGQQRPAATRTSPSCRTAAGAGCPGPHPTGRAAWRAPPTSPFVAASLPRPNHLPDLMPVRRRPRRQPCDLPIQIGTLIMRGHPRVQNHPPARFFLRNVDPDRPRLQPPSRHWHLVFPEPPVRGLRVNTIATRPLSQLHATGVTHTFAHVYSRLAEQFATLRRPADARFVCRTAGWPSQPFSQMSSSTANRVRVGTPVAPLGV